MKKLILQMQMSVDGFVGANENHPWQLWGWGDDIGWDEELKRDFNAVFAGIDTILLSRKMAEEGYLTHWGNAARKYPADPFYAFAQRIVEARKVVPSDRLETSRWERTTVVSGDLPREVNALKAGEGGDMAVFGGAGFASALIAAGVVDEFQLFVNPAVLGAGRRIFDQGGFRNLLLLGSKAYACGMVVSRYAPAG
ncbi:dihydrofolate reductase family protein [Mesorhizobium sp. CO1-1-7]|uniref:Dihydrofolate reductase n=1 Tax=Mesorhizobium australicum (strain HAMBI 3006 / LMG 24608 / WSM2073) TaxID=754035 RepID=L0KKI9_MESAW|nr:MULTISPECIES: dihydrofolate reductase family protein [Mesorhizobium]MBZ9930217.1 dihydrofolate reductase family protein [Mesorhizobium sp. BR1-1-5]AGB45561.1 dihydrofolate reductase [Mesorhizobium australicum WSM2073]MBZ9696194.1 dihydrofolate reductase family protein [Mesorhizobium sp. CO1-1-9]MBZ9746510.1 dihydrofolate reductase family protein [Mesorhizobium sp. CO1-1-7]MBZ9905886.1 dihydrofolate reductase family protein [Mesorhizobium sp. BR115XR7A]